MYLSWICLTFDILPQCWASRLSSWTNSSSISRGKVSIRCRLDWCPLKKKEGELTLKGHTNSMYILDQIFFSCYRRWLAVWWWPAQTRRTSPGPRCWGRCLVTGRSAATWSPWTARPWWSGTWCSRATSRRPSSWWAAAPSQGHSGSPSLMRTAAWSRWVSTRTGRWSSACPGTWSSGASPGCRSGHTACSPAWLTSPYPGASTFPRPHGASGSRLR